MDGATQSIVPDNAPAATRRPGKGDSACVFLRDIRSWPRTISTEMIPASVRKLRDKGAEESAENTINKHVIDYLAEEIQMHQSLPDQRFDTVAWKQLKAGRNYHATAAYQHYAVPYETVGKNLQV